MRTSVEKCGGAAPGLTVYQSPPTTPIRPALAPVAVDSKNHALALAGPPPAERADGLRVARPEPRPRAAPGAARRHHPAARRPARHRRPPRAGAGDPEPPGLRGGRDRARRAAQPEGRRVRAPARRVHLGDRRPARERPGAATRDPPPRGRDGGGAGPRAGSRAAGRGGGGGPDGGRPQVPRQPGRRGAERRGLPLPGHLSVRAGHDLGGDARPDGPAHAREAHAGAARPRAGPIASPGLEAIQAALDPAPVKYLYFVARDDRRHHFSTTMEEHNAAVTRYRLSRR